MKTAFFHPKSQHFPHISRFISVPAIFFMVFSVVGGCLWLAYVTHPSTRVYAKNPIEKPQLSFRDLQKKYDWWKAVVAKQPEYIDGYVMASYYANMLGKKEDALSYLAQALVLDPNNEKLQTLAEAFK